MADKIGKGQTALITGASGGIGLELAGCFAEGGFDLVLVARRKDELEKLARELSSKHSVKAIAVALDLTRPSSPDELFAEMKKQKIDVDVLVNNAGFGSFGKFWELETAKELQEIQLNVVTLAHLTKLFLAPMVERKRGRILNVASTAAFQPGPFMAVYYATKAFVLSLSEAIASELAGTGVTVTALCPGPTETGFQAAAAMEKSGLFSSFSVAGSKGVAEAGYRGCLAGKVIVIPGVMNKMMVQSNRVTPRAVVRRIVKRIQAARH